MESNSTQPCRNKALMRPTQGFTLIELMIVVAIIAIIAAIAYPAYINSVTKTNRAAAKGCLSEHANFMERYYTTNLSYYKDTSGAVIGGGPTLPALGCDTDSGMNTKYAFSFSVAPTAASPNTYTIQAVPKGVQATRDTQCGTLTLDQAGTRTESGTGTLADCW
ncbi:MAG TPA: type IV pilin protein [Halothiobacillus sp.]|nr:type IV pilin protein [Halothiobacillus sp.]